MAISSSFRAFNYTERCDVARLSTAVVLLSRIDAEMEEYVGERKPNEPSWSVCHRGRVRHVAMLYVWSKQSRRLSLSSECRYMNDCRGTFPSSWFNRQTRANHYRNGRKRLDLSGQSARPIGIALPYGWARLKKTDSRLGGVGMRVAVTSRKCVNREPGRYRRGLGSDSLCFVGPTTVATYKCDDR